MTADETKKLKYAVLLSMLFIIIKSYQELQLIALVKAIFISILLAFPILVLVYKKYLDTLKISSSTKKGIGMLSVPIFLLLWRYLHVVSRFYETVLVLILVYVLIETIILSTKNTVNKSF